MSGVLHLRSGAGRPLCGYRAVERGWSFARTPGEATCRRCWKRYRPPKAQPLTDLELAALDQGWRQGWEQEFPGADYPGMVEARRRILDKLRVGGRQL